MLKSNARPIVPTLDIHGAFVRRANLGGTLLRGADMSGADATNANFRGADLTDAENLTLEQLSEAEIDDRTILPDYIDRAKLGETVVENIKT